MSERSEPRQRKVTKVTKAILSVLTGVVLLLVLALLLLYVIEEHVPYGRSFMARLRGYPAVATVTSRCPRIVPGSYIIQLWRDPQTPAPAPIGKPTLIRVGGESVQKVATDLAQQYNFKVIYVYEYVLGGFAAEIPDAQLHLVLQDKRVQRLDASCIRDPL
jgi:hypothetical protein